MNLIELLILGGIQGITEWIPISSKTQVTFVYLKIFHGDPSVVIPILLYLHLGTVLAATFYFRNELSGIFHEIIRNPHDIGYHANSKSGFLLSSLVFTGIIGIPLLVAEKKFFPSLDAGLLYAVMGAGLIVTGLLLLSQKGNTFRTCHDATWKDGIITGILQGFSVLPGISRSGTSTTGLIWNGFDSKSSFYLSFLLSIPTVIFAEIILAYGMAGFNMSLPVLDGLVLFITSLVIGYITLESVLKVVQKINIAYIVFGLGALILLVGLTGIG